MERTTLSGVSVMPAEADSRSFSQQDIAESSIIVLGTISASPLAKS